MELQLVTIDISILKPVLSYCKEHCIETNAALKQAGIPERMFKVGGEISQLQLSLFIESVSGRNSESVSLVGPHHSRKSESIEAEELAEGRILQCRIVEVLLESMHFLGGDMKAKAIAESGWESRLGIGLECFSSQMGREHSDDFISCVKRLVSCHLEASVLLTHHEIAEICGCSERTFQRNLKSGGYNYRSLLAEVRYQLACKMLRTTDATIEAVAFDLGYSCHNSLIRAFKNASGVTPAEFRLSL